jgi:hypothetical protein
MDMTRMHGRAATRVAPARQRNELPLSRQIAEPVL